MPINIFNTFDDPSATNGTQAFGINDMGQIVGAYFDATGMHGFLESGGMYTTLVDPSATRGTIAEGINAAGQIVGTYFNGGNNSDGFVLSGGVYTTRRIRRARCDWNPSRSGTFAGFHRS